MKTILADKEAVMKIIPQAPPMVMVDRLIDNDEATTSSDLEVTADNVFCQNGYLSAAGLAENIAQTAAARGGYAAQENDRPVNIGFIASIRKFKVHALPAIGKTIETRIEVKNRVMNFNLVTGQVFCEGELMAECDMRIYEKTD